MKIAEVRVNVSANGVDKNFSYRVPEKFNFLATGWRVVVPFHNKEYVGFVMEVKNVETEPDFELKNILEVLDAEPWFTPTMLAEARWLANFYLCPLAVAMSLFMAGRSREKISVKSERVFKLAGDFDEKFFTRKPAQLKLLKFLQERGELSATQLTELKIASATAKTLVDAGLISVEQRRIFRDSYSQIKSVPKTFELTNEQVEAIAAVEKTLSAKKFGGFLLHGVTGSGKTQVYIELAKITCRLGRRVLILVPEIALTAQIVKNFKTNFSDVAVVHSRLSFAERNDAFCRIRNGEVSIVIGARSALFTPVENVGLIVVDEEQDNAYKQDEKIPRYQARVVAEEFAKIHDAAIVFGSATPSLENFYRAHRGELTLLKMPRRVLNNPLPEVKAVDMRAELKSGNRELLSRDLLKLLEETLADDKQAIILLNRRGWSTVVMCRACGSVVKCPDCGLPVTFHIDGKIRCHHCEFESDPPTECPECGSDKIKFLGVGTEKLELALKLSLPNARVLRMDRDSTRKKFGHDKILKAFANGEYNILFGTQMVAKGHDIRAVTAVGILNADASLSLSNFRAAEVCFTLITQAAGRAGRADLPGKVIVQAYNVDAPAIRFGCAQDYEKFAASEFPQREEIFFPPFSRMVKLIFTNKDELKAKKFAKEIVKAFREEIAAVSEDRQEIMGPIPAAIAKLRGLFRFSVVIKSANLEEVQLFLRVHKLNRRDDVSIDFDPTTTD